MDQALYQQIQKIERDHWWYVARRTIIFDWVLRQARRFSAPRVLDIGCGTGFNIECLKRHGLTNVVGLDVSSDALTFCRSRQLTALVRGDATRAPFRDGAFDLILALDLIEHVQDDETAVRGLASLLAPNGALVVFTPAFQFLWGHQDEVSHHYRRYTAAGLRATLERAGLRVDKLTYANTLLFPVVWAGRVAQRMRGAGHATSENEMHPAWSNGVLRAIFAAERPLLRRMNLPFGVSLLALAIKPR